MPTTLPVRESHLPDPAPVPMPLLCLGVPVDLWIETLHSEKDLREFWRGYALSGTVCALLLVVELVVIVMLC
ncbi:hypothetical protein [Mesorhizobium marinum]|uniref:hypothetical protein n=1 Tax=Mesorhizobium marinum TaxID=3228790 RepID=UPI0034661084